MMHGCYFYDTADILVLEVLGDEPYLHPHSFTPNDDNINDVLYIYGECFSLCI